MAAVKTDRSIFDAQVPRMDMTGAERPAPAAPSAPTALTGTPGTAGLQGTRAAGAPTPTGPSDPNRFELRAGAAVPERAQVGGDTSNPYAGGFGGGAGGNVTEMDFFGESGGAGLGDVQGQAPDSPTGYVPGTLPGQAKIRNDATNTANINVNQDRTSGTGAPLAAGGGATGAYDATSDAGRAGYDYMHDLGSPDSVQDWFNGMGERVGVSHAGDNMFPGNAISNPFEILDAPGGLGTNAGGARPGQPIRDLAPGAFDAMTDPSAIIPGLDGLTGGDSGPSFDTSGADRGGMGGGGLGSARQPLADAANQSLDVRGLGQGVLNGQIAPGGSGAAGQQDALDAAMSFAFGGPGGGGGGARPESKSLPTNQLGSPATNRPGLAAGPAPSGPMTAFGPQDPARVTAAASGAAGGAGAGTPGAGGAPAGRVASGALSDVDAFLQGPAAPSKGQALLQEGAQGSMADALSLARSGRSRDAGSQARLMNQAMAENAATGVDTARNAGVLGAQEADAARGQQLQGLGLKANLAQGLDSDTLKALGLGGDIATQLRSGNIQERGQDLGFAQGMEGIGAGLTGDVLKTIPQMEQIRHDDQFDLTPQQKLAAAKMGGPAEKTTADYVTGLLGDVLSAIPG